jgi:hypothetical protein
MTDPWTQLANSLAGLQPQIDGDRNSDRDNASRNPGPRAVALCNADADNAQATDDGTGNSDHQQPAALH